MLKPNAYFSKVQDITIGFLIKNEIKALILDVDNTLIDKTKKMEPSIVEWVKSLKGQGFRLYILSNTNDKEKVEKVAKELQIPFENFAMKPLKRGFLKVQKIVNEKPEVIAVVGDQIFTDVVGGNRCKMFTILVEPIAEKDIWITMLKRPIENKIKQKYHKKIEQKQN